VIVKSFKLITTLINKGGESIRGESPNNIGPTTI